MTTSAVWPIVSTAALPTCLVPRSTRLRSLSRHVQDARRRLRHLGSRRLRRHGCGRRRAHPASIFEGCGERVADGICRCLDDVTASFDGGDIPISYRIIPACSASCLFSFQFALDSSPTGAPLTAPVHQPAMSQVYLLLDTVVPMVMLLTTLCTPLMSWRAW